MKNRLNDRRRDRRCHAVEDHGILAARVRLGHRVAVIDVSAGGALVESNHRLLPGSVVELHVEAANRRATIRGRVLRCAVVRVHSSELCYRGAIMFDRHFGWLVDSGSDGHSVPLTEVRLEGTNG
jgi:hypothetical protein